eukprot:347331-Chlamydomonas_euryale.AAC.1
MVRQECRASASPALSHRARTCSQRRARPHLDEPVRAQAVDKGAVLSQQRHGHEVRLDGGERLGRLRTHTHVFAVVPIWLEGTGPSARLRGSVPDMVPRRDPTVTYEFLTIKAEHNSIRESLRHRSHT